MSQYYIMSMSGLRKPRTGPIIGRPHFSGRYNSHCYLLLLAIVGCGCIFHVTTVLKMHALLTSLESSHVHDSDLPRLDSSGGEYSRNGKGAKTAANVTSATSNGQRTNNAALVGEDSITPARMQRLYVVLIANQYTQQVGRNQQYGNIKYECTNTLFSRVVSFLCWDMVA